MPAEQKITEVYTITHGGDQTKYKKDAEDIIKIVKANKERILILSPSSLEGSQKEIIDIAKLNIEKGRLLIISPELATNVFKENESKKIISKVKEKFGGRISNNARVICSGTDLAICSAKQGKNIAKALKIPLKNVFINPRYSSTLHEWPFAKKGQRNDAAIKRVKEQLVKMGLKHQPSPSLKNKTRATSLRSRRTRKH